MTGGTLWTLGAAVALWPFWGDYAWPYSWGVSFIFAWPVLGVVWLVLFVRYMDRPRGQR